MPSFTYSRLIDDEPNGQLPLCEHYHQTTHACHRQPRTVLRIVLFLLLFALSFLVFFLTISLSLFIGTIHHEREVHLEIFETTNEDEIRPDVIFYGDTGGNMENSGELEVKSWADMEARLPKVSRGLPRLRNSSSLLDLPNFSFHLTANRSASQCPASKSSEGGPLRLVILIHSSVSHFAHRQKLRRTWLSLNHSLTSQSVTLVSAFILGQTSSPEMQFAIEKESHLYGDLVQGTFLDTYRNLTYKHLAGMQWAVDFGCSSSADYFLKVDDDAFVDTYAVVDYLSKRKDHHPGGESFLGCSTLQDNKPQRGVSKWALSSDIYPFEDFPAYCSGVGYFITADLIVDLLNAAEKRPTQLPQLQIDDVFVTGLLRSILQPPVKPVQLMSRYVYRIGTLRRWLQKDAENVCPSGYLIGDIGDEEDAFTLPEKLWKKTEDAWRRVRTGKCPPTTSRAPHG